MKITKTFVENAVHALTERALKERTEANRAERRRIGKAIYDLVYPEEVQILMEALPDGAFQRCDSLRVSATQFNYTHVKLPDDLRIFSCHQYGSVTVDPGTVIGLVFAEYERADAEREALNEERSALAGRIRGVLASVTTTKKLFEVWPECTDVLAPLVTDGSTADLPAVVPQELNRELKLP